MSNFEHKYYKYKSKYDEMKKSSSRQPINLTFDASNMYNMKINKNMKSIKKRDLNRQFDGVKPSNKNTFNCIDVGKIKIPEKYETDSILYKANYEYTNDEEFKKNVEMFTPSSAQLLTDDSTMNNFNKGIFNFKLKDGTEYELTVVPFLSRNIETNTLYWPWISSGYIGLPQYDKPVSKFHDNIKKHMGNLKHLNFDCVSSVNFDEKTANNKIQSIFYDIYILAKYFMNGLATINAKTPKIPNIKDHESIDFFMVTKIKKV